MDAFTPRYAGFWKRSTAYAYDVLIVQVIALLFMLLGFHLPTLEDVVQLGPPLTQWLHGYKNSYLIIGCFYHILCIAGPHQATPGKRYCGIRVVTAEGGKPTLAQAAIRHAACAISTVTGGFGFLTIAFTKEKLGIHDIIADTRVIYTERNV